MEVEKELSGSKSGRERETLFRTVYSNHTSLRQIVDGKANMIISINTVIISSIIAISGYGMVADKLDLYRFNIIVPIVLIMLSCLTSAIFAILAARPRIIKKGVKINQSEKRSLLFFGEIAEYTQQEFILKMEELLNSRKDIYEQMIIDLYSQGVILKHKYNLLSYAYQVMMFGFAFGVIIYLIFLVFKLETAPSYL
jgi:hypothetical protein